MEEREAGRVWGWGVQKYHFRSQGIKRDKLEETLKGRDDGGMT